MNKLPFSIAVVIPIYNEEHRLFTTFSSIDKFLKENSFSSVEIIFVDDGSEDESRSMILSQNFSVPHRLVDSTAHSGKGAAVRMGMIASESDYAITLDADMSTPISEINKLIPYMNDGYQVIIGSRKIKGSKYIVSQPLVRKMLGVVYIALANAITGISVSDVTCGFKCFSREAIEKIFPLTRIDKWSYDAEVLFLARKFGFRIGEIPVLWRDDPRSHVNLFFDTVRSFTDLFKIRFSKYKNI